MDQVVSTLPVSSMRCFGFGVDDPGAGLSATSPARPGRTFDPDQLFTELRRKQKWDVKAARHGEDQ